jgi:hypothetical protein
VLSFSGCRLFFAGEVPCVDDSNCPPALDCVSGECAPASPPEDGGAPPDDRDDAGEPVEDAGEPVEDAGAPPDDAGAPPDDAGEPPVDAGVDAGPVDPCEVWAEPGLSSRAPVVVVAQAAQDTPAGYPLRLRVDHGALPGAGADGAELRLYHCDGAQQVEVPLRLARGEVVGGVTTWFFRAGAPLPVGAVDSGYLLYFDGTPAGARLESVPEARVLSDDSPAQLDVGTTLVPAGSLTLPATTGDERWLVFASWSHASGGNVGSRPVNVRLDTDTTNLLSGPLGVMQRDGRFASGAIARVLPAGTSTVDLGFVVGNGGDASIIRDVTLVAAQLPAGLPADHERASAFTVNGSRAVDAQLPANPLGAEHLLLSNLRVQGPNGNADLSLQMSDDAGGFDQVHFIRQASVAGNFISDPRQPLFHVDVDLPVGAERRLRMFASSGSDADYDFSHLYLPVSGNFDVEFDGADGALQHNGSGFEAGSAVLALNEEVVPHELVLIASATLAREVEDLLLEIEGRITVNSAPVRRDVIASAEGGDAPRTLAWVGARDTTDALSLRADIRSADSSQTAILQDPRYVALRYFEVATTLGAVEPRP